MGNDRERILAALDVEAFYASRKVVLKKVGTQLSGLCPFHEDTNPSFLVDPAEGVFNCRACQESGSVFDYVMRKDGVDFKEALKIVAAEAGVTLESKTKKHFISEVKVTEWHKRLLNSDDRVKYLQERRGLTTETIKAYKIGWDGSRYTIPIRDEHGRAVNVRKYNPTAKNSKDKMISHVERHDGKAVGFGKAKLLPARLHESQLIVMTEGEMDCLLAIQNGFPAMTVTSGAGTWNKAWTEMFEGKDIVIAYDNDKAGRKGANRIGSFLHGVAKSVAILVWPTSIPDKYDITDWFISLQETAESFQDLIDASVSYSPPEEEAGPAPVNVELVDSSAGENIRRPIKMRVMVSGKDTHPYIVPGVIDAQCDEDNGNTCNGCGMHLLHHGDAKVEFLDSDRETLGLMRCSDEQQKGFIKKKLGIMSRCARWNFQVKKNKVIEQVQVIPELNGKLEQGGDSEFVSRVVYALKHRVKTNTVYDCTGYPFPDVRDQHATVLIGKMEQVETSIDDFELDKSEIKMLQKFQPKLGQPVQEKFYEIADEMSKVHHIRGRRNLQIALDLVWHSVLSFRCFNEYQRKGWTEAFIVGDSGQGKTTVALALADHYRAGQRVQAEQSSSAGLIGGLVKQGERWQINWGPIVLCDRRLLVIDEWSGVSDNDAEKLTDVRSSGVAEIMKIHRERAWARTRLVFLSNPKEGRPLASYEHGVEVLHGLFKKAEDIRRIDIAMCVASGQISLDVLNMIQKDDPCPYTTEQCSRLVLWAWSRKVNQINFPIETQTTLLDLGKHLSKKYTARIPLIEPADIRWKLARLSAATAARLFSTKDGITLDVLPEHAEFAAGFLHTVYSDSAMSYDRYSRRMNYVDEYVQKNKAKIVEGLRDLYSDPKELIEFLMMEKYLVVRELEAQLGVPREDAKKLIQFFTRNRLVDRTHHGYRKRPRFVELLRELEDSPPPPKESWEGESNPLSDAPEQADVF